ncbi:hypothetical protein [Xanthomarina gelatinilytica]|uniref:hypothetical protein n=1 Tax=Xanthomarina gelatinilytica TaxID=1137281 RepID=UPI003AA7D817
MGALFFLIALIIGVVICLIVIAILIGLIGVGIISTSVLTGLYQRSIGKGFKTFFVLSSILGSTIVSVVFFWFINTIKNWWSTDLVIVAGIGSGIISGWLLGLLLFVTLRKMMEFIKTKYESKKGSIKSWLS